MAENPITIRRLILKRFRSVPAQGVVFSNPTFLVGKNGSGKSNVVDAFAFLSECMALPLQAVFDTRGGIAAVRHRTASRSYPPNMGIGIEFDFPNGAGIGGGYAFEIKALPNYGFKVVREQCRVVTKDKTAWFDRGEEDFRSTVRGIQPSFDPQALALPVVGGTKEFAPVVKGLSLLRVYSIEPTQVRELQEPDVGTNLKSDGSNLASVLQALARKYGSDLGRLCEILETIIPGTMNVRPVKHGKKLSLEFTQQWGEGKGKQIKFEAFVMSDGTLRALGILGALFQKPVPTLIAIEEPESTIHPEALGTILDVIRMASATTQIVATTHSPELLDADWIEPENIRIVTWGEGVTRVLPLGAASVKALKEHLMGAGEQFRSNALRPDEYPLFEEGNLDQPELLFQELHK
jgi:predicted ATPase